MLQDLYNIDLSGYGLYLDRIVLDADTNSNMKVNIEFTVPFIHTNHDATVENLEEFLQALKLVNKLKVSTNPTVLKHYEQLLMLLAIAEPSTFDKEEK